MAQIRLATDARYCVREGRREDGRLVRRRQNTDWPGSRPTDRDTTEAMLIAAKVSRRGRSVHHGSVAAVQVRNSAHGPTL
jgi:hypothetical protein